MGNLTPINHMAYGKESVKDADLIDMEMQYSSTLPWMAGLLDEIQFLRGGNNLHERIKYLEGRLDQVHAQFDA
jgi:hypothetical protein